MGDQATCTEENGTTQVRIKDSQLTEIVGNKVAHIMKQPDSPIAEMAKSIAREVMSGELDEKVKDSIERYQKNWSSMDNTAQRNALALAKAEPGSPEEKALKQGMFKGLRVAPHAMRHPMFESEKEYVIGEGDLFAKGLYFAMLCQFEKSNLRWDYVRDLAHKSGDKQLADIVDKNLQATDFSNGGSLIPPEFAADLIGFLHGMTCVRNMGPAMMQFGASSEINLGKINGTVSGSWGSENFAVNASDPSTGDIVLTEKELNILVILSERFLRQGVRGGVAWVRDLIRKTARTTEELKLLRGDGSAGTPQGLRYKANANNVKARTQASGTGCTVEEIIADLLGMQENVHGADGKVAALRPGYILQHRTKLGLMAQVDANDNPSLFTQMVAQGEIFGAALGVTSQLPENLSTDTTEAYYAEWSEVIIADGENVSIRESSDATVTDSNGNDYKLFQKKARAMLMVHTTDITLAHDRACAVRTSIDWGADKLNA